MRIRRRDVKKIGVVAVLAAAPRPFAQAPPPTQGGAAEPDPRLELVQPELFPGSGGQANCAADFDNDGELELFVGFKADLSNRLYRNDRGTFKEVAAEAGVADLTDMRAAGWAISTETTSSISVSGSPDNQPYPTRSTGTTTYGKHFTDVGHAMGLDAVGESRQISWIDYDNDGRMNLLVVSGTRRMRWSTTMGSASPLSPKRMRVDVGRILTSIANLNPNKLTRRSLVVKVDGKGSGKNAMTGAATRSARSAPLGHHSHPARYRRDSKGRTRDRRLVNTGVAR